MEVKATAQMKKFAFLLTGMIRNKTIASETIESSVWSLESAQLFSIMMKTKKDTGVNALHSLALNGNSVAIKCILDRLNPDHRLLLCKSVDNVGCTALHHIAGHGPTAISSLLSPFKQDEIFDILKIQNRNGNIAAIHFTAWKGKASSMKTVMDLLTDAQKFELLKVKNKSGNTPLHLAAWCGCVETIKCMLGSVVEQHKLVLLNIRREDGITPLRMASQRGNDAAVACLEDFYCTTNAQGQECPNPLPELKSFSKSNQDKLEASDVKYKELVNAAVLPLQSKIHELENLFRQQFSEHLQKTQRPSCLPNAGFTPTMECGFDSEYDDLSLRFDLDTIIDATQPEEDSTSVASAERDSTVTCAISNDKGCHDINFYNVK
ncbi:uncharacterized protein [Watersipora subatra]|uniref:uncharacterized protein n=1 Tax=Watersipora subatra TaxID=2589382 RepID=UPI00355C4864